MTYKTALLSKLDVAVEEAEQELKKKHSFYIPKLDKDGKLQSITIDRVKLLEILMENGFFRYDLGVDRFCFIQVLDKKVKQVSITYIMDWWFSYLKELPNYSWVTSRRDEEGENIHVTVKNDYIQNKFLMAVGSYFSDSILSRLTTEKEIKFNADSKIEKYLYYQNGFVTICKEQYWFTSDYSLLKHHIWENQILNRDYNQEQKENFKSSEFFKFCFNISNQDEKRLLSLQTIIGYLLHDFYHYKMRATILTDAQIGVDGEANGRTGKGIFANGLKCMLNNLDNKEAKVYCQINGKGFDFNDKHRYSNAGINTKLIHLEDIKAYFDEGNRGNIRNIVSLNAVPLATGDLSIYYERVLTRFFSLELGIGKMMPWTPLRLKMMTDAPRNFASGSRSFLIYPKFYIQKPAPEFFFIGILKEIVS